MCAARAAQSKSAESQDALEVGKQHLDPLAITARLLKRRGVGKCSGDIAGILMDAARDFALGRFRTASRLQRARAAVRYPCAIKHLPKGDEVWRGKVQPIRSTSWQARRAKKSRLVSIRIVVVRTLHIRVASCDAIVQSNAIILRGTKFGRQRAYEGRNSVE